MSRRIAYPLVLLRVSLVDQMDAAAEAEDAVSGGCTAMRKHCQPYHEETCPSAARQDCSLTPVPLPQAHASRGEQTVRGSSKLFQFCISK